MIIVVTGSREADASAVMDIVLTKDHAIARTLGDVRWGHGACKTGADAAVDYLIETGVIFKWRTFPAAWRAHGKAAGPIRNREMMKAAKAEQAAGEDVLVMAFFAEGAENTGTTDACKVAVALGLHVERHTVPKRKDK